MRVTKLDFPVMSSWMENNGRRLDCTPYLSGAFEAKVILKKLPPESLQPLHAVTKGGLNGIFHAGRERRQYVDDPAYGVPFLGSTDILAADLSSLSLLSKKQVAANPNFAIQEGWTLITRSGTIGRMVYVRSDMAGMACTEHAMRVAPDVNKILPGYLYAYLSSKFGVPLVISGTYGSIIQSIEPQHLADLPVPRLDKDIEEKAHNLVNKAASNRVLASKLLAEASEDVIAHFKLKIPTPRYKYSSPSITSASSFSMLERIDAYYYAKWNEEAYQEFSKLPPAQLVTIGDITEDLYIPNIFKRFYAEDPKFGYAYLTGADIYVLAPTSNRYLSKKLPDIDKLVLRDGMILVQDSGQIGGLIGRPVAVGRYLSGFACTNNMVRIVPHSKLDQGYIFAVLNTEYGIRLLTREATGSSIPHLDEKRIRKIQIPWTDNETRKLLGRKVLQAIELRDEACDLENEARAIVDNAIRDGGA
ncbi:methylation-associated defense system restriction endonuclease subunit S MAD5 [Anabaena lutea]|uniref:Restriction endonuclease subunit S n=1 Tax=Anabaena lutea FACHB-196 TaxID=2692881 RepID=A0ABR8F8R3_9NOST|nr:restriction endonuclease subunit S [Anabaena lutea]MBD2566600.1 restriction endonuclease subunit S [Anabaena lutea FACHB-196]